MLTTAFWALALTHFAQNRSLITGFARFVEFVADFDWKNQFLLIDFNNEFKSKFQSLMV